MQTIPQGTAMSDNDIHRLVQHHDGQLSALNSRVGHVEHKLDAHDVKLDKIIAAVTTHAAQPKIDIHQTIRSIGQLSFLFGSICAGIIYLATRQTETPIALIQKEQSTAIERLERVESLLLPERWASKTSREAR
jgi:hypothetical protein